MGLVKGAAKALRPRAVAAYRQNCKMLAALAAESQASSGLQADRQAGVPSSVASLRSTNVRPKAVCAQRHTAQPLETSVIAGQCAATEW